MSSQVDMAHVCRCGHYRVRHDTAAKWIESGPGPVCCKDCDCEAFEVAQVDAVAAPRVPAVRTIEYDEPKREPRKRHDALAFRSLVRRLRRAQIRQRVTGGARNVQAAISLEREVDGVLLTFSDDPLDADPQGELFHQPEASEYFRRNSTAAKHEAERCAKREHKSSVLAGFTATECKERAERASRAFYEALRRVRR